MLLRDLTNYKRFSKKSIFTPQNQMRFCQVRKLAMLTTLILCIGLFLDSTPGLTSEVSINMEAIAMIESSDNHLAHNRADDSRGLYQITPIALKDYNQYHKDKPYTLDDLWNPQVNSRIAYWMFSERIPQLLKHFKQAETIDNYLIAYNCGIKCVIDKRVPTITKSYLRKYRRLTA